MSMIDLTVSDAIALAWFIGCWIGFGWFSRRMAAQDTGLLPALRLFRARWMERMCRREQHQADATILGNLLRGALFFASTTVFILGGLVALLGTAPRVNAVMEQLPFSSPFSVWLWEAKVLILIYIFIYAFFKFSWSAWQYNALSIVVGAAPDPADQGKRTQEYIESAATLAALAGESFNRAIRAYYFSMAVVTWFVHPFALILTTTWVTFVLYRREFRSPTQAALRLASD